MQPLLELWTFATAWYNLPFTLALLAFLALSALQFVGLGSDHDADVHADIDHDVDFDHDLDLGHDLDVGHDLDLGHDVDVGHDLDLHHDLDIGHDVDMDHDADVGHDLAHDHDLAHEAAGAPAWLEVLRFLGVGQAPVTIVVLLLIGAFGLFGWIANGFIVGTSLLYPRWAIVIVPIGAIVASALLTSHTARLIGRLIPGFSSTAISASQLVSKRGRVASLQVDDTYGQVKIRDSAGTLITVFAKVDPGKPPIPRDSEVYLVDYDEAKKVYTIVPSD